MAANTHTGTLTLKKFCDRMYIFRYYYINCKWFACTCGIDFRASRYVLIHCHLKPTSFLTYSGIIKWDRPIYTHLAAGQLY